jgi:hypothetical protein
VLVLGTPLWHDPSTQSKYRYIEIDDTNFRVLHSAREHKGSSHHDCRNSFLFLSLVAKRASRM